MSVAVATRSEAAPASRDGGPRSPSRPAGVGAAARPASGLTIGALNDPAEYEADALTAAMFAGRSVRPTRFAPPVSRKCATCDEEEPGVVRRKCAACEEEDKVRRDAWPGADSHAGAKAPPSVASLLAQPGRALDPVARSFFEQRLGTGLGGVRIHDGPAADAAARSIGARAFTAGRDIAFARGGYDPESESGLRLLGHELVHVAQNGMVHGDLVRRSPCGHDGKQPGCGAGSLARWNLTDLVTQEVENIALDDKIVRDGLNGQLGNNWVTQITTPPNPRKSGKDRGRLDGARVSGIGQLKLEIVEVKSRATAFGGCALATREAQGYVDVLTPLGPRIVDISARLAPVGGLRIAIGDDLLAADRLVLNTVGINIKDKVTKQAWTVYNGLQNRLNTTFTTPFTDFKAELFTGGTQSQDYKAGMPVMVECTKRGKKGIKARQLLFQVNGAGGVSYRCDDTECETEEEEKKKQRQVQPQAQPQAEPQTQPQDQTQPKGEKKDEPVPDDKHPWVTPAVMTGAGAATLTGVAIAAARAKAKRLAEERIAKEILERAMRKAAQEQAEKAAARNVINLAERRAAKELAERGGERVVARTAGKAAGKALIYAEVAVAVFLVASGKAEAKVGFGPSAFEALYDSMKRSGHEPSPEMKALIESDPVLKKLAEQAAQTGDPTPLQEEATKRMMELVRDNPGEFTADELEILRQASNGTGKGVAPKTREELRAAIDRAVANQGKPPAPGGGSGQPGGSGSGSGSGSGQPADKQPGDPSPQGGGSAAKPEISSGDLPGQVDDVQKKFPGLSPAMTGQLALLWQKTIFRFP